MPLFDKFTLMSAQQLKYYGEDRKDHNHKIKIMTYITELLKNYILVIFENQLTYPFGFRQLHLATGLFAEIVEQILKVSKIKIITGNKDFGKRSAKLSNDLFQCR